MTIKPNKKIEVSLRAAIIAQDVLGMVNCDDVDTCVEHLSKAVGRLHELDKVLFAIKEG